MSTRNRARELGRFAVLLSGVVAVLAATGLARASDELAASYHLNEGQDQSAKDTSGAGQDASLGATSGVDADDPAWIDGRFGAALHFGSGQFAAAASTSALEPVLVSVEAWVRNSGSPGAFAYVVSKGASACDHASYALYTGADGGLRFYVRTSEMLLSPDAGTTLWDGAWHHVVGTYDGLRARLFVDAVEVGAGTAAGAPLAPIAYGLADGSELAIGAYRGTCSLFFSGDIDEVKVWSRALSPAEISTRALGE